MSLFTSIFLRLIPLYIIILLGFFSAKKLNITKEPFAKLLIYIISPIVIFYGTYSTPINPINLSLPLFIFLLCCLISILFLHIGKHFFPDSTKNILALSAGTGNTGYFGLPVIAAVLGEQAFGLAIMAVLGFVLFENTLGYYLTAKGHHTTRQSLLKLARLPAIYAFLLGLTFNFLQIPLGEVTITSIGYFKGTYTILGMMLIGMGLTSVNFHQIDYKYLYLTFLAKFIVWPAIILGLISLDLHFFHIYSLQIHNILLVISIVPLAANTVVWATELQVHPDKAALAVFTSTIFALFYIPILCNFLLFQ